MKHWRTGLLLLGLLLVLASFAAYGLRISQTPFPAGASEQEIQQLREQYGLVGPLALQYPLFSFLFLPGMVLLAVYGTLGLHRGESVHMTSTKVFLILILFSNGVTAFNYLLQAPPLDPGFLLGFSLNMLLIALILATFVFAMMIWRGFRWGVWAFGISSSLVFVLSLMAKIPVAPACLGPLGLVILYVLIRPVWIYME